MQLKNFKYYIKKKAFNINIIYFRLILKYLNFNYIIKVKS